MKKSVFIGVASVLMTSGAFAADQGYFAEAAVGTTKVNLSAPSGFNVKDTDTSLSLLGGYMFNKNVGLDGGYLDLGKASMSATAAFNGTYNGQALVATGAINLDAKATGFTIGARGDLPVSDKFSLVGRAGLYNWNVDTTINFVASGTYGGTAFAAGASAKKTYSGTDPYFGIGANYAITKQLTAGLSYTAYRLGGDIKTDVSSMDLRLNYRF